MKKERRGTLPPGGLGPEEMDEQALMDYFASLPEEAYDALDREPFPFSPAFEARMEQLFAGARPAQTAAGEGLAAAFGRELHRCRKQADMTLAQLAEAAGISCSHLGKIEKGQMNITARTIEKLATALGLKVRLVLSEE